MASQVPPSKDPLTKSDRAGLPRSSELEKPDDYKQTFKKRGTVSKFADPCEAASKASLECLERSHYNKNECMDFFRAYRECKGKWLEQRREDRRMGRA